MCQCASVPMICSLRKKFIEEIGFAHVVLRFRFRSPFLKTGFSEFFAPQNSSKICSYFFSAQKK
jgi:hypothetical protein